MPTFSVITVCLNADRFIEDTLVSVKEQSYPHVEHIVIDGGSVDGTLEIVHRHPEKVSVMLSEPDHGIYDAMNKGIARAKGDYLLFLNADDYLADADVLADVARQLESTPGIDLLYGGVDQMDPADGFSYLHRQHFSLPHLKAGAHPPHQACFFSRRSVEEFGGYHLGYRVCGDFELILRYFLGARKITYLNRTIAVFRTTGFGSTLRSSFLPIRERVLLLKMNFGGAVASKFWITSRFILLRKCVRAGLKRGGLLKYWRAMKLAFRPVAR